MKKLLAILLVTLMGTQSIIQAIIPEKLNIYGKKIGKEAIAISAAYSLQMALNLIHEMGHATAGKLLYNAPFDITLGAGSNSQPQKNIVQLGWLKINSFIPFGAFARIKTDDDHHPLKWAAVALAGPILGATAATIAYMFLKKYDAQSPLHLCECLALGNILSNLLLENGLLSGFYFLAPKLFSFFGFHSTSDFNQAIRALKEYYDSLQKKKAKVEEPKKDISSIQHSHNS